jgi:hypothetical protein
MAARKWERQERSQILQGKEPLFVVERIVTEEGRSQLRAKVVEILNFYELQMQSEVSLVLRDMNRSTWKSIDVALQCLPNDLPIVVWDKNRSRVQAVAMVSCSEPFYLHLEFLATAPHNLDKHSGAGTAAFEDAVWLGKRRGALKLGLLSRRSALPFYEKMGVQLESYQGTLLRRSFDDFLRKKGGKATPIAIKLPDL